MWILFSFRSSVSYRQNSKWICDRDHIENMERTRNLSIWRDPLCESSSGKTKIPGKKSLNTYLRVKNLLNSLNLFFENEFLISTNVSLRVEIIFTHFLNIFIIHFNFGKIIWIGCEKLCWLPNYLHIISRFRNRMIYFGLGFRLLICGSSSSLISFMIKILFCFSYWLIQVQILAINILITILFDKVLKFRIWEIFSYFLFVVKIHFYYTENMLIFKILIYL